MTEINDPNDMNEISAKHTDDIEEAPDPDAVANPGGSNGDGSQQQVGRPDDADTTYQDDLDTSDSDTDPAMNEMTEDPADELQVPIDEYKDEIDQLDLGDHTETGSEDARENIEDKDEDDDNPASMSV
jgi:hypothetical protein